MDEPLSKRRKTSPLEDIDRSSSPLKQPPRRGITPLDADRSTSPLKKPPRRGSFQSFASPTKASLARHNPGLLLRPTSAGSTTSREEIRARGKQRPASLLGEAEGPSQVEEAPRSDDQEQTTAASLPLENVDEEEEDLPATSSAMALSWQGTPRRGILANSPSKPPPRRKAPVKPSLFKSRALQELQNVRSGPPPAEPVNDEAAQGGKTKEPFNLELEKKKQEKALLERELKELEEDVARCVEEVRKGQNQNTPDVLLSSELDDLISFINKICGLATTDEQPLPVSVLLCSFLPFTTLPIPPPLKNGEQEKPIPSHEPLELDDPLPYLQLFTSFKFTNRTTLPNLSGFSPSSSTMHQQHTIDITGPQKLLCSTISIKIDAQTHQILSLQIPRLSPWAERELGQFMRRKAQSMDLGTVAWAMQSYWEIAKKRAEYWHKCERDFSRLIVGRMSDDTENIGHKAIEKSDRNVRMTRQEMRRHLGRDVLTLQDKHILLKIRWSIGFDWSGEAESVVYVEPALPRVWTEGDSQNSLSQIPKTFDALLRTRGAFGATQILIAMLFFDES
ncbi:uncharacterized protein BDR25DRAFT_257794 [Lindgomyces ingoldianus]|uniref:Uncharacterized protein n=1 Tax=Lindgomyces ingoldianus TaxID=673940 RepID=A0ACB6R3H1_9PLEO|nr:uncharacterized protein BDR25DRAFT_257794 [Lindgomyces ingoldianus]KAF2473378.1 hypothetical protein BDR25DRAFT_257794 [Lindgomyces ingoldianus]